MRYLSITDQNKDMVIATLWGAAAEMFKATENVVIVIRKAVTAIFQDIKKINCTSGTLVLVILNNHIFAYFLIYIFVKR